MGKMAEYSAEQHSLNDGPSDCDGPYSLPGETPTNVSSMMAAQFKRQVKAMLPRWCRVSVEVADSGVHTLVVDFGDSKYNSTIADYGDAGLDRVKKGCAVGVAMGEDSRRLAENKVAQRAVGSGVYSSRFD